MVPIQVRDIFLYYSAFFFLAVFLIMRRRGRPQVMRLKMTGGTSKSRGGDGGRILNVVFNYNGETWDAYEVLGLPAGSSTESVEQAYQKALSSVNPESRSFLEAAYSAIQTQKQVARASGDSM